MMIPIPVGMNIIPQATLNKFTPGYFRSKNVPRDVINIPISVIISFFMVCLLV